MIIYDWVGFQKRVKGIIYAHIYEFKKNTLRGYFFVRSYIRVQKNTLRGYFFVIFPHEKLYFKTFVK